MKLTNTRNNVKEFDPKNQRCFCLPEGSGVKFIPDSIPISLYYGFDEEGKRHVLAPGGFIIWNDVEAWFQSENKAGRLWTHVSHGMSMSEGEKSLAEWLGSVHSATPTESHTSNPINTKTPTPPPSKEPNTAHRRTIAAVAGVAAVALYVSGVIAGLLTLIGGVLIVKGYLRYNKASLKNLSEQTFYTSNGLPARNIEQSSCPQKRPVSKTGIISRVKNLFGLSN